MQRPLGVTIIAILAIISGLFKLCLPTLGIAGSSLLFALGPVGAGFGTVGILVSLFFGLSGILFLVGGFGLWRMRKWGWWLAIIGTGFAVAGVVVGLFTGAGWAAFAGSVLDLIVFVYLVLPGTRRAFGFGG
jgi:hypothetical protein